MPRLTMLELRAFAAPFILPVMLALLLPACATSISFEGSNFVIGNYKSALRYYERGEVMLARAAAIGTNPSHPDYQLAQTLLKEKIEPARLRLLRHYRREAVAAERKGELYRAKELYLKTASVWVGDDKMLQEAARVDLILRQRRLDQLIVQRRKEDMQLLDTLNRYGVPKGLDPQDKPMAREQDRAEQVVETRGRYAWVAAKRELREDHPEIAYVEAESYLRLQPGSRNGPKLMQEVKEALPKGLRIPQESRRARSVATESPQIVTADQINQLMQQGKWLEAYKYTMVYRRNGGDEAEELLQNISKAMKKQAEAEFRKGQVAFQNEKLDEAVAAWSQAVELQPDNRDYADSLRRATELQERFRILQSQGADTND